MHCDRGNLTVEVRNGVTNCRSTTLDKPATQLLLVPQLRTCSDASDRFTLSAIYRPERLQHDENGRALLDDLVGACEQSGREREIERLGGGQIQGCGTRARASRFMRVSSAHSSERAQESRLTRRCRARPST